ncbi:MULTISPECIES: hypothetical protein [Glycomyces]|jgi:hypothetical protein|uniref:Uncharacterized protein n=1 Tax=Glycomyces niveus TaxID=2820287 RepID=A0ABS3U8V0_9ACTN|nr:hypothetical protein [Glycomyces sp. NEAU-S30]MBO3735204.1 hypothetical protein [Glycomyces sp. NEAU-S30]
MANIDEFSSAIAAGGEGVEQARAAIEAAKATGEELIGQFQVLGVEDKVGQAQAIKEGLEQVQGMLQAAKDSLENLQNQTQALKG